eukprot:TRINITY_DN4864_c0_g1_i2.p1 TRINITY_DN4864_c0_g1~~TRINITY_DN4864_c0_g1_i2.p1  ORF type:complete len:582 (-),score=108.00 TRINITY_DN4864_c0_g1_i2:8-1753(-)
MIGQAAMLEIESIFAQLGIPLDEQTFFRDLLGSFGFELDDASQIISFPSWWKAENSKRKRDVSDQLELGSHTKRPRETKISALVPDVLGNIFGFLDLPDMKCCRLTTSSWCKIIDAVLIQHLKVESRSVFPTHKWLKDHPKIQRLSIGSMSGQRILDPWKHSKGLPSSITSLKFDCNISEPFWSDHVKDLQIRFLEVMCDPSAFRNIVHLWIEVRTPIDLSMAFQLVDPHLSIKVTYNPNGYLRRALAESLQTIPLPSQITSLGIDIHSTLPIALDAFVNVVQLCLTNCCTTSNFFQLENLKSNTINWERDVYRAPKLKILHILGEIDEPHPTRLIPNVTHLHRAFDFDHLSGLVDSLPNLIVLELSDRFSRAYFLHPLLQLGTFRKLILNMYYNCDADSLFVPECCTEIEITCQDKDNCGLDNCNCDVTSFQNWKIGFVSHHVKSITLWDWPTEIKEGAIAESTQVIFAGKSFPTDPRKILPHISRLMFRDPMLGQLVRDQMQTQEVIDHFLEKHPDNANVITINLEQPTHIFNVDDPSELDRNDQFDDDIMQYMSQKDDVDFEVFRALWQSEDECDVQK